MRKLSNNYSTVEHLEHRRLFSVLDELRGITADRVEIDAPSVLATPDLRKTHLTVDGDLRWLANNVADGERGVLRKADSSLLTLYSRARRGLATSARDQLVEGVNVASTHIVRRDGVPLVHLTVTDVDAVRTRLQGIVGVQVAGVVDRPSWQLIDAYVPIGRVLEVANLPGVKSMHAQRRPHTNAGSVSNSWDRISGAEQFRSIFPLVQGTNIDFGVISDSIDEVGQGIAASQLSGDLPDQPGEVRILEDGGEDDDTDEGRAMAELIYDIAPNSEFIFHTANGGVTAFANGIDELRQAGADVIVDDVTYAIEPAFQDGAIAQAVDDVVRDHGVLYFTSAGNHTGASVYDTWSNPDGDDFHNFDGGGEIVVITVPGNTESTWFLQFDEPWGNSGANLEIQVFEFNGGVVGDRVAASNDDNTQLIGGDPFDDVTIENDANGSRNFALSIKHIGGDGPSGQRLFLYTLDKTKFTSTDPELANEQSVYGHHNSRQGISVGAVPITSLSTIEPFSSIGGIPIVFNDSGDEIDPVVRDNPTFVAADGVRTSLARFSLFFGTSAAAPNAAAVAGLMMEVQGGPGSLTRAEFLDIAKATATDLGDAGYDATFGHGRIDALAATLAAKGPEAVETVVELNQFGDAELPVQMLGNATDVNTYDFATDADGVTIVSASRDVGDMDAGLMLYDRAAGDMTAYDYQTVDRQPVLVPTLDPRRQYAVEVFTERGSPAGSVYTLNVNAPTPDVALLALDADGDHSRATELGADDSDYARFFAPASLTPGGTIVITLDPDAALNGVLSVFDRNGDLVARRDGAGAGGVETIRIDDATPGREYVVRVGSSSYATAGEYTLTIDAPVDVPPTFLAEDVQGTAIFNHTGLANDSSGFDLFLNNAGDVDSLVFAGNSGWDGTYEVKVTSPLTASDPSTFAPVVGVYDGDSGQLIAIGRGPTLPGPTGRTATVTFEGVGLKRYVLAAGAAGGLSTGELRFTIEAPSRDTGTRLELDVLGDALDDTNPISPAEDSDFYSFTVPAGVTTGILRFQPGNATVDGVIGLFDDADNFLGATDSLGGGFAETRQLSGLVPGQRYRVTVLADQHRTAGPYTFSVDLDVPTGAVSGLVFEDLNGNGTNNAGEPGVEGRIVFVDLNNNGLPDALSGGVLEPRDTTNASGAYHIDGVPVGEWKVRQVQAIGWGTSTPQQNHHEVRVVANAAALGKDFGVYAFASLPVRSWSDIDGNGVIGGPENGLPGRTIYVDYDNDSVPDLGEPSVVTGGAGFGQIEGIVPGTWPVREVLPNRTWERTQPASDSYNVTLVSGQTGPALRFGSLRVMDFGDAPASYGTDLAGNGARHFARSVWYLGRRADWEFNGAPNAAADGDDAAPAGGADDEDGVRFLDPLVRGSVARVVVQASRRGRLNGWVDLNADGDFFDPGDFVLPNVFIPSMGTYTLPIPVPAGATLGDTYARFRFNAAGGIGPVGLGLEGEVEDYAVRVVPRTPVVGFAVASPAPASSDTGALVHSAAPMSMGGEVLTQADPGVLTALRRARFGLFAG